MLKIGQKVHKGFGTQVMEVIGFEPDLIENVLTQWEDADGNVFTAKFMEAELELQEES